MKKVAKIIILFLIALALNIVFSNKLYAFEWTTKISQENIAPGDEFYIEISLDCSALNGFKFDISVSDTDCIEIVYNKDGSMKTEYIKDGSWDGNWKFRVFFKAKKAGKANIKIELRTKSFLITWDKKETNLEVTIGKSAEQKAAEEEIQKMQNAWQNIPSDDASADDINTFVQSAAKHSGEASEKDKFYDVELEKLQAWEKTLGKVVMQQYQTYSSVYYKICARIR